MIRALSLADAVVVAAATMRCDPAEVVETADVGVLVGIVGRSRTATDVPAGAAELLVGVAASRPFARENRIVAWALAAHLVTINGARLRVDPDQALTILQQAEDGNLDEAGAARTLHTGIERREGAIRRLIAWSSQPTHTVPATSVWSCPVCDRDVATSPGRSSVFLLAPSAHDLVVDCSARHRAHAADGSPTGATDDLQRRIAACRARLVIRTAVPVPA